MSQLRVGEAKTDFAGPSKQPCALAWAPPYGGVSRATCGASTTTVRSSITVKDAARLAGTVYPGYPSGVAETPCEVGAALLGLVGTEGTRYEMLGIAAETAELRATDSGTQYGVS